MPLPSKAKGWAATKSLGHHFNDVIRTAVAQVCSTAPSCRPCRHAPQYQLPRRGPHPPDVLHPQEDILAWKRYNELNSSQCACRFTENCTCATTVTVAQAAGDRKFCSAASSGITPTSRTASSAASTQYLDTMPGYKSGVEHSFLERSMRGRSVPTKSNKIPPWMSHIPVGGIFSFHFIADQENNAA